MTSIAMSKGCEPTGMKTSGLEAFSAPRRMLEVRPSICFEEKKPLFRIPDSSSKFFKAFQKFLEATYVINDTFLGIVFNSSNSFPSQRQRRLWCIGCIR